MIRGIGLDLCEIARMEKLRMMTRFIERYFSEKEQQYIRAKGRSAGQTMAGIFAAKEALGKALGKGLDFELSDAEVWHDDDGCPYYHFQGEMKNRMAGIIPHLSISHDGGIAGAVCLLEYEGSGCTAAAGGKDG